MLIVAKVGIRTYEFNCLSDFEKAQKLYSESDNQEDFETKMEFERIEFYYELPY